MEIKLFGRSLFEVKKKTVEAILTEAQVKTNESKFLPDFAGFNASSSSLRLEDYVVFSQTPSTAVAVPVRKKGKKATLPKKQDERVQITPKGVYEMKLLHDESYRLNTNPEYVDQQLADFKQKLALIKSEEWDVRRGVDEIGSMVIRLENRKKYPEVKEFFEQFPYTMSSRIDALVKAQDHLKLGKIAEFIADMPKDATDVMKRYNEHTKKVCDKQAVFYIIANKKDFERTSQRRDPILLAQSPFGHFWQILGAWDEEMLFLEQL